MGLFDTGGTNVGALLGGINKSKAEAMGQLANVGAQGAADVNSAFTAAQNKSRQQLDATGMSNSTISPSIGALFGREKSSALRRLMDSLAEQRTGVIQNYGRMTAEANAIPKAPGMGWGILGNLLGAGASLGGAALL